MLVAWRSPCRAAVPLDRLVLRLSPTLQVWLLAAGVLVFRRHAEVDGDMLVHSWDSDARGKGDGWHDPVFRPNLSRLN
jgi:hypothetical protein